MGADTEEIPESHGGGDDSSALDSASAEAEAKTPDVLKGAPPKVRKQMLELMAATFSSGQPAHPLFEKLEPGHIDKFLDYSHEDDKQEHEHRRAERWFRLGYSMLFFLAFFGLVWLLSSNQPLLLDLLKILVAFAGGFGAGYGYKTTRDRGRSG